MEESSSSYSSLEISQEKDGIGVKYDGIGMENDGNEIINDVVVMENRVNVVEEEIQEPKVGMLFNTIDEVLDYYKKYGKQLGFPVKKRSSTKDDDGVLRYATISCARSGKSQSNSCNVPKPHPSMKTDCKAQLRAGICFDGRWRVNSIKLNHNHDLSPETHYFRRNRVIRSNVKRKDEVNERTGIKRKKNHNLLVVEAEGHENILFMEKDNRNYTEKVGLIRLKEEDASAIQIYFLKMQTQNANFFYALDLDKEGRLKNVFWADARSRAAYEEFSDVITFDTTYLTDKFDLPFAPFVGVNHHGQSILFGCGLISNEDTETFIWLFQSWLACMSGRAPSGIITDQDKAIKKAIENVFPNARHRWCFWNIMKKLPEKLKGYKQHESIRFALQSTVCDSLIHTEFEERWNDMMEKYKLHGDDWLIELYNERCRWVPGFVKDGFWAGMSTTQQSESMHAFFDDHVNFRTTLKQLMEQYENALRSQVEKEKHEDCKCFSSRAHCITHYDMEKQAQDIYTVSKYKEFQNELTGKMYCDLASVKVDGALSEYQISEDIMIREKKRSVIFKVWFHECDNKVNCSCCMFEFKGILCRHAIYVLVRHKIHLIPDKYILRRWRKDVKRCHTMVKINYDDWNITPEAQRCNKMRKTFVEINDLAKDSEDKCMIVMDWMHKLKEELLNQEGHPND